MKSQKSTLISEDSIYQIKLQQKQQLINLLHQDHKQELHKPNSFVQIQEKLLHFFMQIKLRNCGFNVLKEFETQQVPYLVEVIANIILNGLQAIASQCGEQVQILLSAYRQNPLSITLSESIFSTVVQLLPFVDQADPPLGAFVAHMLICQEGMPERLFRGLHQFQMNKNGDLYPQLSLGQLKQFLNEDAWTTFIFKEMGGNCVALKREQFVRWLEFQISLVNDYFMKKNMVVRVIENSAIEFKQIQFRKLFDDYLVMLSQFKGDVKLFSKKVVDLLYSNGQNEMDIQELQIKTKSYGTSSTQLMFIIPQILQLESQLINLIQIALQQKSNQNIQDNNNSLSYIKVIQKLKNKCIYNGEDQCQCKKCQCIRRNRSSARQSQKRKREALEQIGPLQEEHEMMVKKVSVLEQENQLLRGLLIDVFNHPSVRQISSQFLEPLTKIISADSDQM